MNYIIRHSICLFFNILHYINIMQPNSGAAHPRCGADEIRVNGLGFRNPPGARMFIFSGCFVLSGRGIRDELISRPETYKLSCVVVVCVCDLESRRTRRPLPVLGRTAT